MVPREPRVVRRIKLLEHHQQTGFCIDRSLISEPPPVALMIVQFDKSEYNLIHLDADGKELTDSLHDSVEEALEQARLELMVEPNEWKVKDQAYRRERSLRHEPRR